MPTSVLTSGEDNFHAWMPICGAKPRLFATPFRRLLMNRANVIKVENHEQFLQDCATLLAAGEMLLIYPKMGCNPEGLGP